MKIVCLQKIFISIRVFFFRWALFKNYSPKWGISITFTDTKVNNSFSIYHDHERYGTGDKNNKNEKSVNGTQIFHWEVSTVKTGLPFQKFLLFPNISSRMNRNAVFHLQLNRNFRNSLVNGKWPVPFCGWHYRVTWSI